ncbi:TPA: hypothetical protein L9493_005801, partial [Klebsiella variicola subsp. variicola]|nr:hypothetical protein [Klebsiella variicola subsp. variicola]
ILKYIIASKRNQYIIIQEIKSKGINIFDAPSDKSDINANPDIIPTIVEAYDFPALTTGNIINVYICSLYFLLLSFLPMNLNVSDAIDVAITSIAARE